MDLGQAKIPVSVLKPMPMPPMTATVLSHSTPNLAKPEQFALGLATFLSMPTVMRRKT